MKELSGKELVERNVSVQLARKPTAKSAEGSVEDAASGEDKNKGERPAKRGRGGFRGRGRGRGGRGGFKVMLIHFVRCFCHNCLTLVNRHAMALKPSMRNIQPTFLARSFH